MHPTGEPVLVQIFLKETTSLNYGAVILNYGRCHCVFTPKAAYFGAPVALNSHAKAKAEREAAATAKAEARAARIKAGDLNARFANKDHMLDTMPLPSDMENASRDALAALHLNQSCTGLGENDALFELRYCDLTPDQRDKMIIAAKEELKAEAKETKDAQPGILAAYRKAMSAERIIYVCACCGLRNFSVTGEFREMSLDRLEPLRYTASKEDTERWERITRAHALTETESGKPYSCVFNYYIYILRVRVAWAAGRPGRQSPPEFRGFRRLTLGTGPPCLSFYRSLQTALWNLAAPIF